MQKSLVGSLLMSSSAVSSSGAARSPADRLVTACRAGDLPSAVAALADGASVNEKGTNASGRESFPLRGAVWEDHHDVVVWLLSHGADPNGPGVMWYGAFSSTAAILQLLIDVGGDVNRAIDGRPPLVCTAFHDRVDNVRVLLAEPTLDLTVKCDNKTPEQYARHYGKAAQADMIAREVSEGLL